MSGVLTKSVFSLQKRLRVLLTITTILMMLFGLGLLVYYFYDMAALLGVVLMITYILLGPVNIMEKGIRAFSAFTSRFPVYGHLIRRAPESNPRILAVLLVYFVFFAGFVIGTGKFLPILTTQLGDLGQKMGVQLMDASDTVIDWADRNVGGGTIRHLFATDIDQAEKHGLLKTHSSQGQAVTPEEKRVIQQTVIQNALTQLETAIASLVPNFISLVGGTAHGFLYFLIGLVLTFYALTDGYRFKQEFIRIAPATIRQHGVYLLDSFHQVMFAFVKGQVLLGVLTGVYMFIIYSLFHVPYAFLLGCVFALAELLPVVGTWIGIIVGLTIILLNMDPSVALWVWLCSYAYQTIKDNILAPKVVGDVMGLHPLVIILALLIFAKIAGLLGVLLALPLASAINVVIRLMLKKQTTPDTQIPQTLSDEANNFFIASELTTPDHVVCLSPAELAAPAQQDAEAESLQDTARVRPELLSPSAQISLSILCVLILLFAAFLATEFLTSVVCMLAASLIVTYFLLGPVRFIEAFLQRLPTLGKMLSPKLQRAISILLVYILFFGVTVISIFRIALPFSLQVKEFARDIPTYISRMDLVRQQAAGTPAEPLAVLLHESLKEEKKKLAKPPLPDLTAPVAVPPARQKQSVVYSKPDKAKILSATYTEAFQKVMVDYKQYVSRLGGFILDLGATTLSGVIYALTTLVLVFYLLHDGDAIRDGFVELLPSSQEKPLRKFLTRLHLQFYSVIQGQILMAFLSGLVIYLPLLLLGLKYPLMFGVVFGITSILPIIGPWLGLLPIVLVISLAGHPEGIMAILLVAGLFYFLKAYWLWPKLIHRKFDVHPILFILSFLACIKLVGFWGILLSFPMASVLGVTLETLKLRHSKEKSPIIIAT